MGHPTEKMIRFANKIAWGLGMDDPPSDALQDYDACSAFIRDNKDRYYQRQYEHRKWLQDMEREHGSVYAGEHSMPYSEEVNASDFGIYPWGDS